MRLVHLYGGNLYGGVERLLVALASHAAAMPEWEQTFGLCYPGRLADELDAAAALRHDLGGVRVSRPWQIGQARARLGVFLARAIPDAVVCHSLWAFNIFAAAAQARRIPVLLWAHDPATGHGWLEAWARRRRPQRLITHSCYMAATLSRLYPDIEATVLHAPVERPPALSPAARTAMRATVRAELRTHDRDVVILQASRLEPWKGHELHLRALAAMAAQLPPGINWTCWFAGGAQRPHERKLLIELRQLARALGIDARLRWLGERRDVDRLMLAADIFCQPNSAPEPFGLVFIEALLRGLPVVGTARGGVPEILTPGSGILAEPTPVAVAAALLRLVLHAPIRAALAAAAPARALELCDPGPRMRDLASILDAVAHCGRDRVRA